MTNAKLPTVPITSMWHGAEADENNIHSVALSSILARWLDRVPVGVEFTAQEATDLIQASIDADIANRHNPEDYDRDLSSEGMNDGDALKAVQSGLNYRTRPVNWRTYSNQFWELEYANPAYYANTSTDYLTRYNRTELDTSVYRRIPKGSEDAFTLNYGPFVEGAYNIGDPLEEKGRVIWSYMQANELTYVVDENGMPKTVPASQL